MSIKETAKNASIRIVNILSLFYDLQCDMCGLILDLLVWLSSKFKTKLKYLGNSSVNIIIMFKIEIDIGREF